MVFRVTVGKVSGALAIAALAVVASAVETKKRPQMEHNAFLRKPVFTTKQLTSQVKADPTVLRRYEKHFQTGEKGLVEYMDGLHLQPLKETKRYLVYNVDGQLHIGKKLLTMRRGTLVFADKTGKPIMKRSCGNPMVSYIPPRGETSNDFAPPKPIALEAPPEPETFTASVEPPIAFVDTGVVPTAGVDAPPSPTPLTPAQPLPLAGGGFAPFWPIFGLPLIPALIGGGGGGGGTPPDAVPEPAGMVAILAGGAGFFVRRRRKKG